MSKYHVQTIFSEFPWLLEHFPQTEMFQDAKVSKIDFPLLCREAGYRNDRLVGEEETKFFLFTQDGSHLGNAHKSRSLLSFIKKGVWTRTVLSAVEALGTDGAKLWYIVEVTTTTLKVYKPMKGFPPSNLLAIELNHRQQVRERSAAQAATQT